MREDSSRWESITDSESSETIPYRVWVPSRPGVISCGAPTEEHVSYVLLPHVVSLSLLTFALSRDSSVLRVDGLPIMSESSLEYQTRRSEASSSQREELVSADWVEEEGRSLRL